MTMNNNGCEFGRTNRIFIKEIKSDIELIKVNTNHFSKRLPEWATLLISLLMAAIGLVIGLKF